MPGNPNREEGAAWWKAGLEFPSSGRDPSFTFNEKAELMNLYMLPNNSQVEQHLSPDLKGACGKRFYLLLLEEKDDGN